MLADAAAATPKGDLEAAKQAGCQWLVRTEVQVTRLRQEVNGHVISLNQTVYRVGRCVWRRPAITNLQRGS